MQYYNVAVYTIIIKIGTEFPLSLPHSDTIKETNSSNKISGQKLCPTCTFPAKWRSTGMADPVFYVTCDNSLLFSANLKLLCKADHYHCTTGKTENTEVEAESGTLQG